MMSGRDRKRGVLMIENGRTAALWLLSGPGSSYALHAHRARRAAAPALGAADRARDAEALAADPLPARARLRVRARRPRGVSRRGRPALRPARPVGAQRCRARHRMAASRVRDRDRPEPPGRRTAAALPRLVHQLDLTLHYRVRRGTDVVERWTTAAPRPAPTPRPVELLRADSAAWTLPAAGRLADVHVHGRWSAESQLARDRLPPRRERDHQPPRQHQPPRTRG